MAAVAEGGHETLDGGGDGVVKAPCDGGSWRGDVPMWTQDGRRGGGERRTVGVGVVEAIWGGGRWIRRRATYAVCIRTPRQGHDLARPQIRPRQQGDDLGRQRIQPAARRKRHDRRRCRLEKNGGRRRFVGGGGGGGGAQLRKASKACVQQRRLRARGGEEGKHKVRV